VLEEGEEKSREKGDANRNRQAGDKLEAVNDEAAKKKQYECKTNSLNES
jgi:hypothetical protein